MSIFILSSCNKTESNNKYQITGFVRAIAFEPIQEDIYYEDSKKGTSNFDDSFTISVPQKDEKN